MGNKVIKTSVIILVLVILYGLVLPRMISARDDLLTIGGMLLAFGIPVFGIYKLVKIAEKRGEIK